MTRRPVHGRDKLGRHRVDLTQIRSPVLRYGLAVAVVALVVGAAWWSFRDDPLTETDVAGLVPWLGWGALAVLAVAVALAILGRGRR